MSSDQPSWIFVLELDVETLAFRAPALLRFDPELVSLAEAEAPNTVLILRSLACLPLAQSQKFCSSSFFGEVDPTRQSFFGRCMCDFSAPPPHPDCRARVGGFRLHLGRKHAGKLFASYSRTLDAVLTSFQLCRLLWRGTILPGRCNT